MQRLFGIFSKLNDRRVENPLGVGLGLAICKQLVELARGQVMDMASMIEYKILCVDASHAAVNVYCMLLCICDT